MIANEIKNINSDAKELRTFGMTLGIVLGLLGALLLWRNKQIFVYFIAASAGFIASGLLVPSLLRRLHKAWMALSILMGWFMTRVILILLYYLVITPIGLLKRTVTKDSLQRDADGGRGSYWIQREPSENDMKNYENQF